MEVLRPFEEFLIAKGEVRNIDEIFDHEPDWLLTKIQKYSRDPEFLSLKPVRSFDLQPYRLYTEHTLMNGRETAFLHLRGTIKDIRSQAEGWGLPVRYVRNLIDAYDEAVQIFAKRYPDGRDVWTGKGGT